MNQLTVQTPTQTLPALITAAGEQATLRFFEFFAVNIRNPNTRAAYARAAGQFLAWCKGRELKDLRAVQPLHVAAYIELLQKERSAPTVKQHLACIRMLFDWLVTGQIIPSNPAHSVRGPRYSTSKGKTPVLSSEEATALLKGMNVSTVVGLRDRALIAVMTYTFARVGAVVALKVEDYYPQSKVNEMPCHHNLEHYLDTYLEASGGQQAGKGAPLFRAAIGKTKQLTENQMSRVDVWKMVRRRAHDAGIETKIGCHTFRATGITDYLKNDGRIEIAQRMAGHSNAKTTGLYDRRNDDVSLDEVERIRI
jgi:integrase/recombinase XerD